MNHIHWMIGYFVLTAIMLVAFGELMYMVLRGHEGPGPHLGDPLDLDLARRWNARS